MRRFLHWLLETWNEFLKLRVLLHRDLVDDVNAAEKDGWSDKRLQSIKVDIRRLFDLSGRLSLTLTLLVLAPLIVTIICLVKHAPYTPYGAGYTFFALWSVLIGIVAMFLFWPLVGLTRTLKKLPEVTYRELMQPLWISLDFLNLSISVALLCYFIPSWEISAAFPIFAIIALLWLFAPLTAFVAHQDRLFVNLRLSQLGLLFIVTFVAVLSPVPMSHFQVWAQRETANKIRPVEQREVTANWSTLQWFTQEGMPLVWVSGNADRGFRLWASPGHDPDTNEDLKPVADNATKDSIVAHFTAKKAARDKQVASENEKHAAEVKLENEKRLADAKTAAETARAQKEKDIAETRQRLIREYVYSGSLNANEGVAIPVLIVLTGDHREEPVLSERISKILTAAGFTHRRSVFTPAFIASNYFEGILAGKQPLEQSFHAADFAGKLLVIQTGIAFSKENPVASVDMLAGDATWDVRLISTADARVEQSTVIKVRGVGFKEAGAQENAVTRAETEFQKQIPSLKSGR
jgi:hypothetical protein